MTRLQYQYQYQSQYQPGKKKSRTEVRLFYRRLPCRRLPAALQAWA
jgi:hypothetical protein